MFLADGICPRLNSSLSLTSINNVEGSFDNISFNLLVDISVSFPLTTNVIFLFANV